MTWPPLLLALLALLAASPCACEYYTASYGYKTVPGVGTYKVHAEPVTWKNAWRACSEEDAHLVIIETPEEAEAVRVVLQGTHLRTHGDSAVTDNAFFVSVGFHSLYSDRFWTTVFGDPLDQYYHMWARGRPSNFGGLSQCGAVNLNLELVDVPCDAKKYPFVCERVMF